MGFGERHDMSAHRDHEMSAALRVSHLPLVRSALQSVTWAYSEAKGRYPLLGLVGGVAEVGVRNASMVALSGATPLIRSLGPQIEVANNFALVGLDQLERTFPVLNQSTDEVDVLLPILVSSFSSSCPLLMVTRRPRPAGGVSPEGRLLPDAGRRAAVDVGRLGAAGASVTRRLDGAEAAAGLAGGPRRLVGSGRGSEPPGERHRLLHAAAAHAASRVGNARSGVRGPRRRGRARHVDPRPQPPPLHRPAALPPHAQGPRTAGGRRRSPGGRRPSGGTGGRPGSAGGSVAVPPEAAGGAVVRRREPEGSQPGPRSGAGLGAGGGAGRAASVAADPRAAGSSAPPAGRPARARKDPPAAAGQRHAALPAAPAAVGQRRGGVPESRGRLVPPQLGQQPVPEGHGRPSSPAQESLLQGRPQPGPRPPRRRPEAGPGDGRRRPTPSVRRRAHPHAAQAVCVAEPKGFRLPQPQRRRRVA
ncbi:perilipin 6 isoform X5 [Vanacampus margaritifer]